MARVTAPDATEWLVAVDTVGPRLRWRPTQWWRQRRRRPPDASASPEAKRRGWLDWIDVPAFDLDDAWIVLVIVAAAAALIIAAAVLGFLVLPVILIILDLLLLVVGVTVLFVWRTVTRAGWTIIAASERGEQRRWHAPGWFAARRAKRTIAAAIEAGSPIVVADAEEIAPPR